MQEETGVILTELKLPFPLVKTKKSEQKLSANIYRNAHYFALSNAKNAYNKICYEEFERVGLQPFTVPVKVEYKLYFKGVRRRDLDNFWFPVSKFLNDCLVSKGILPDDDIKYLNNYKLEGYLGQEEEYVAVVFKEL